MADDDAPTQQDTVKEEEETKEQDQDFHGDYDAPTQPQNYQADSSMIRPSSALAKSLALFESTVKQLQELGPSFSLNLFSNGYTIGTTEEFYTDVPGNLIPYDLRTDTILRSVERGRLVPGIVDDRHCKYVNGTVLCEIRDYRNAIEFPIIDEMPLKMGMENVVKDISLMSDELNSDDKLKFEAKVLKHLHPYLHLDPTATLVETIPMAKRNLRINWGRNRRKMDDESNEILVGDAKRELGIEDQDEKLGVANQDVEESCDSS